MLQEIKESISGLSYDKYKYLTDKQIDWLIKQAEKMDKIEKISVLEDITLADFGKETLSIIEGKEVPTRKERT